MKSRENRASSAWHIAILSTAAVPIIFIGLGSYGVVNGDEAVFQGIAEGMVESGSWLHLDFFGEHRTYDTFQNAPLQYWARAILIELFGRNLWTMRILSAFFGWATVVATYALARRLRGPTAGLLAGLVQLTTFQFVFMHGARTGELDTIVAFFTMLSALLFLRRVGRADPARPLEFLAHHLCVIALLNVKLPVAILPLIAEAIAFATIPRFRKHFWAWTVSGLLIVPWGLAWHVFQAIVMWEEIPAMIGQMLGEAGGAIPMGAASGFWINVAYYAKTMLFGAFPHVLVYPIALAAVLRVSGRRGDRDDWLCTAWFAAVQVGFFLGVALHLTQYLIPSYPFLSVFVGGWLCDLGRRRAETGTLWAMAVIASVILWLAVDYSGFNPFAIQANRIPLELGWRGPGGFTTFLGVGLTALAVAGLLLAARLRLGERSGAILAVSVGVVLLAVGGARSGLPLRYLGYQGEMAQLRRHLDRERTAGRPVATPIAISELGYWRARYYFAREYDVRRHTRKQPLPDGVQMMLVKKRSSL